MTFAIKGQGNRRVRLTRPWKPGDFPLDVSILSLGRAKKMLREGLHGYEKRKGKVEELRKSFRDVSKSIDSPTVAFFKE
jgi:hypothetical protein